MALEHILLGLLRRPASGYELKKEFGQSLSHFWRAELSQIYPSLKRMENQGWLEARSEESGKGPPRRVYRRTPAGRRALLDWLGNGPEPDRDRIGYLAQVFFLGQIGDRKQALKFLTDLRAMVAERLGELRRIEAHWSSQDPRYPDELPDEDFYPQLTLAMGLAKLSAIDQWCAESIRRVEARGDRHVPAPASGDASG